MTPVDDPEKAEKICKSFGDFSVCAGANLRYS